jgi:hypothetical protein
MRLRCSGSTSESLLRQRPTHIGLAYKWGDAEQGVNEGEGPPGQSPPGSLAGQRNREPRPPSAARNTHPSLLLLPTPSRKATIRQSARVRRVREASAEVPLCVRRALISCLGMPREMEKPPLVWCIQSSSVVTHTAASPWGTVPLPSDPTTTKWGPWIFALARRHRHALLRELEPLAVQVLRRHSRGRLARACEPNASGIWRR